MNQKKAATGSGGKGVFCGRLSAGGESIKRNHLQESCLIPLLYLLAVTITASVYSSSGALVITALSDHYHLNHFRLTHYHRFPIHHQHHFHYRYQARPDYY